MGRVLSTVMALEQYGFDSRVVQPQGRGTLGVLLVGEAPGEKEAISGTPFYPGAPAGAVLERAIRRSSFDRDQFTIINTVWQRPPNNKLDGASYEAEAIETYRPMIEQVIRQRRPKAIVTLGSVATRAITGLSGKKLGISLLTGYVLPSLHNIPTIPCFHPSYLRRGKMSHLGVLMRCLKLATNVAREGRRWVDPPVESPPPGYIMYPTEDDALRFEQDCKGAKYIAYDIETNYSTDESAAEEVEGADKQIKSIQFSPRVGYGIYLPWREPFLPIARRLLASSTPKLGWNILRFDDPLLTANQAPINGERHDLMWAWHHLQPDLPRGLQFAAGQYGWPWPWKHLDRNNPQFYGIVDVDVLQWMV